MRGMLVFLKFVAMGAFRATLVWLGTLLADLPSLGLPAISWVQAFGIVVAVRSTLTYMIGVQQIQPQPSMMMHDLSSLINAAHRQPGGGNHDDGR
jgi:hypothetical protein